MNPNTPNAGGAGLDFPPGIENVAQMNQLIMNAIDRNNGEIKEASNQGGKMLQRELREQGFQRRIMPPEPVTNADLVPALDHDLPRMIREMKPKTKGAMTISFGDTADSQTFYANKYEIVFNPITTPEYTKDVNELRTIKGDLRQAITDNALLDMQTEEDGRFIAGVDTIVGPVNGVGLSGECQNFEIEGGITRQTYPLIKNFLEDLNLNVGCALMNRHTAKAFEQMPRNEIGGDLAQDIFKQGNAALSEAVIFGIRHIFTIKRSIVPNGVVYLFTEPAYLGDFCILSDVTMYVEKKKDILRFSAQELIGTTIANVAGVVKVKFLGTI